MLRRFLATAVFLAGLAVLSETASALMIAPPPGPIRLVTSDVVFIGSVTGFEPMDVEARPHAGAKEMVKWRVAIVQVKEVINGEKKDVKTLRVGFIPPKANKEKFPPIGGGRRGPIVEAGQEGLFMLNKHTDGKFYEAPQFGYFSSSKDSNYKEEIATAKKAMTIMANPKAALESKDAKDRLLAAALQIGKYRNQKPPFNNKEEQIDAEESKLIFNALLSAKWEVKRITDIDPQQLFFQLNINENDGFKLPQNIRSSEDVRREVEAWVKGKGANYRIKRFVHSTEK